MTTKIKEGAQPAIELPPALVDADRDARTALDRRARLDEQVDRLADEIKAHESEVDALREQAARAESEAVVALCDDDEARAQQRADELRAQLDSAAPALDRMRRRLAALEAHAPSLDDAIAAARVVFDREMQAYARAAMLALGQELDRTLVDARFILAKMRVLPGDVASLFLASAFVGDATQNLALLADLDGERRGYRNLLAAQEGEPQPAGFDELLAPLRATQAALRGHRRYVPLVARRMTTPAWRDTIEHAVADR